MAERPKYGTVDEYIADMPEAVQPVLQQIRSTLHDAVPGSGERISYNIAAITLDGKTVVFFAGYARHASLYPVPDGDEDLVGAMRPYRSGAGTLKFPLNAPIPYDLVARVGQAHAERVRSG